METETHCLSAFASLLHSAKIDANVIADAKCDQIFTSLAGPGATNSLWMRLWLKRRKIYWNRRIKSMENTS